MQCLLKLPQCAAAGRAAAAAASAQLSAAEVAPVCAGTASGAVPPPAATHQPPPAPGGLLDPGDNPALLLPGARPAAGRAVAALPGARIVQWSGYSWRVLLVPAALM